MRRRARGSAVLTMSSTNTSHPFITSQKELRPPFLSSTVGEFSSCEDENTWKSVGGASRAAEPPGEGSATLGKYLRGAELQVRFVLRADMALCASQTGSSAADVFLAGIAPSHTPSQRLV